MLKSFFKRSLLLLDCPVCESECTVKTAVPITKKTKLKCQNCGGHFIKHSTKKSISNQTKHFIDKLLLEKLSLAGIARVTGVSEKCLQDYVNTKYAQTPRQVFLNSKKGKIVIQGDEAWSFVGNNNNKPWIRLALDVNTKEIAGVYLGDRGELGAKGLWESLPAVYRQ
ncbi:MAG: IS1 family transposase, partial [Cyanobacteria bacterium QH_7_48_89]